MRLTRRRGRRVREQILFSQTAALVAGDGAARILAVATAALLTRLLGAEGYGNLAVALVVLTYLILMADAGLGLLGTREMARHPERRTLLRLVILMRLPTTAVAGLIGVSVALVWPGDSATFWLLSIAAIGVIATPITCEWALVGMARNAAVGAVRVLGAVVFLCAALLALHGPAGAAVAKVISLVVAGLASLMLAMRFARGSPPSVPSPESEVAYRAGVSVAISTFVVQLYTSVDVLLLGALASPDEVGYYRAAYVMVLTVLGVSSSRIRSNCHGSRRSMLKV